ncbi:MAG: hypothetical protein M3R36_19500 [Bacteroidota bacterium]|nr:hypothetical protein [Bacteroidota bacterium]
MNKLKAFKVVLVILVLIILAGCSDQITSTSDHTTNPGSTGISKDKVSEKGALLSINSYNTQIKLKPFRTYTFTVSNTGLAKFNSIDVQNLSENSDIDRKPIVCEYLLIYGDSKDDIFLDCHSNGFEMKRISIENTSPYLLDLDVNLYGEKSKKNTNSEQ